MAWTGSAPNQVTQRTDGVRTGAAVNATAKANGVADTAALADARENDLSGMINLCLKKDGGNNMIADLPMNTHKLTGLDLGIDRTDSIRLDQVQDSKVTYAEASGTANAIILTTSPICSGVEGMIIHFVAEFDSTTAVTVKLNGDGNIALQYGGSALVGGEVNNGQGHFIIHDGTQWQLANPFITSVAQPLDADLTALAANSTDGLWAHTGAGTGSARTITGTANEITATNGSGVSGNPTLSLPAAMTFTGKTVTGGTFTSITDIAIVDGGTGASDAATAYANLKQAATTSATGAIELSTDAEIRSAGGTNVAVTAAQIETAAAFVTVTSTSNATAIDWDAGINFTLTTSEATTISNPTNGQPGTHRKILAQGNNTTDRIITFGNQFLGDVPTITDCDDTKWYMLYLECITSTHFAVSSKKVKG